MIKRSLVVTVLLVCIMGLFVGASSLQAQGIKFLSDFKGYKVRGGGRSLTLEQARNSGPLETYFVYYGNYDNQIGEIDIRNYSNGTCLIKFYLLGRSSSDSLLIGSMEAEPLIEGGRPVPGAWRWTLCDGEGGYMSGSFTEYSDYNRYTPDFNALEVFYYPSCPNC